MNLKENAVRAQPVREPDGPPSSGPIHDPLPQRPPAEEPPRRPPAEDPPRPGEPAPVREPVRPDTV